MTNTRNEKVGRMTDEDDHHLYSTLYKDFETNDAFFESYLKWEDAQFYEIMGYDLPSEEKPNTTDKSIQEILSSLSAVSKKSSDFVSFDTYSGPIDVQTNKPMKLKRMVILDYVGTG